jgi:hypothetical protein
MSKDKTTLTKDERDAIIDALLEESCDDSRGFCSFCVHNKEKR